MGQAADPVSEKPGKKPWNIKIQKLIQVFVGALIAGVGLEIFLVPNNIIDGGIVGISIMMSSITGLPYGLFLVLLNLPFIYMGYKHIGMDFAVTTTCAIVFLSGWSTVFKPIPGLTDDFFLAAIFGGIIDGIGVGLIMRGGGSLDGTEIVAIIMGRKTVYSVGEMVMFMNLFILTAAGFLFGWDKAMYSLVAYYVISKTIDMVLKGLDEMYAVMVVTEKHQEVSSALLKDMGRGVTILHGAGGYSGRPQEILYSVVTRLEMGKLKDVVQEVDPDAFVTIHQISDIVGGRLRRGGSG